KTYELGVTARFGDTITVSVEGTQRVGRSVYFYEPEGGRDTSQCLVGVGGGPTRVRAEETFVFNTDIEQGIRIYKTDSDTGLPISEITFDVYRVTLPDGETVGETPTEDEIATYVNDSNKVGSLTTDTTGYASFPLEKGVYIVVERHNADKVEAPIGPFFVSVPMRVETSDPVTGVTVEHIKVVSVYPKNEALSPDVDDPHIPDPPGEVTGSFTVIKHDIRDKADTLGGATFEVYRTAKADDTDTRTIICKGTKYTVAPVIAEGVPLVLTTDQNGQASSPKLPGGVYFLIETKAPDGYNTLAEAVTVTVTSDLLSETDIVYIANYPGELLPSTGGRGTKWIFIIGGAITAIAALLLINERKMRFYE
ncbi:MAG: LPXTG cell wall anchor domain-containing protein, partial [Clostridia bacterium]|nr:LPXTG cell wall anchor domain-containing protein [Clostridia bacterium]